MSKKWIAIIIYFIFLAALTYVFASFSEADKIVVFLNNEKAEFKADNLKLLSATVIANNHDNTEAYILRDPLYQESFINRTTNDQIRFSVDIYVYALVEFKGNKAHNSVALILKNLVISDDDAKVTNDINDLEVTITFNQNVQIGSSVKKSSTEELTTVYDNDMRLLLFNYDKLSINNSLVDIESIVLTYPTTLSINQTFVSLVNSNYDDGEPVDLFGQEFNRDINNLSHQNINILKDYGTSDFLNQPRIYYNEQMLATFNSYNSIIKHLAYALLLIIPVTYFIFFHKHVKIIIKKKRLEAKKTKEERYQQLKKEIYENNDTLGKKE